MNVSEFLSHISISFSESRVTILGRTSTDEQSNHNKSYSLLAQLGFNSVMRFCVRIVVFVCADLWTRDEFSFYFSNTGIRQ